jgi:hypothetical membrane protein
MFCSNSKCGKELYFGAKVCPHCSEPIPPKTTNEMAVGCLTTLTVIGGILFIVIGISSDSNPSFPYIAAISFFVASIILIAISSRMKKMNNVEPTTGQMGKGCLIAFSVPSGIFYMLIGLFGDSLMNPSFAYSFAIFLFLSPIFLGGIFEGTKKINKRLDDFNEHISNFKKEAPEKFQNESRSVYTSHIEQINSKKELKIPFNKFYNSSFFRKLEYQKCPNSSCDFLVTTYFDACPKCGRGGQERTQTLNQKNTHIEGKILEIKNKRNKLKQIIEGHKKYGFKELAQSGTLFIKNLIRQEEEFQLKQWDLKLVLLVNQVEPLTKNWRRLGEFLQNQESQFDQIIEYHKTNIDSLDNLKAEFDKKGFQLRLNIEFYQRIDRIKSVQVQMLKDLMASQLTSLMKDTGTHHQSVSDDEVLNSIDLLHAYHEIGTFSKGLEKLEDEYDSLLSEQNLVDA